MYFRSTLLLILLLRVAAVPTPEFRDVQSHGPSGMLSLEKRWGDTVGTATQVWMNGAARENTVLHTARSGPLSAVYRDVLNSVRQPCQVADDQKCEVAINGFGTVGEVQYDFNDAVENVEGRSTQVMVACKCVGAECGDAVLIRPVNVFETFPDPDSNSEPSQRICLYEAVGNGFSDCHAELLRSVHRATGQRAEYTHGKDAFVYNVDDPSLEANWTAQGQRGWTRDCLASEIDSLDTVSVEDLRRIQRNDHSTPADNGCKPPNDEVRYFRDEDPAEAEACYRTYEFASVAAAHLATQQDEIATGNLRESYVDQKPSLVSDTELALTCSAAGLGVLFVWTRFGKQMKKTRTSAFYLATVVIIQILSYALEALPLHIALGHELDARKWQSEFAFIDGSVALPNDQLGTRGTAEGSVLVLTAVVGTVQYYTTRVTLVAGLTVAFDLVAFAIIIATVTKKKQFLKRTAKSRLEDNEAKGGWMNHIVGFHSRALQRRESQRREAQRRMLDALDLQESAENAAKNVDYTSVHWQDEALAGISTETLSEDESTAQRTSADIVDVSDETDRAENPDVEDGVTDEMRRQGSSLKEETESTRSGAG